MKRLSVVLVVLCASAVQARPLFVDSFDPPSIAPQFPLVGGQFELPSGPSSARLQWLIGELAAAESTTIEEVNANFDASWLAVNSVAQTQAMIQTARGNYPNAVITDVVGVTPVRATVVVDSPGSPPPSGYLSIGARYSGTQRITQFTIPAYGGSVQYPVDQTLTMAQAADKFTTLSSSAALLVGRIGSNGQCSAIADRNANAPRATASIFKIWVLGGLSRAIVNGTASSAELVPMVASEIAQGGLINVEPIGTPFPLFDLAVLMMGNSDNTATDLVHERVGRALIDDVVDAFGVTQADLLKPLLGISEQFHLFRSFPLAESLTYVNGTQAFRNQFLQERIIPLGPNDGGAYLHTQLLTDGSWRASPYDICRAFANLRRLPQGSEALITVDAALGAGVAQPDVRARWDRVWYKGGSLSSGAGLHVLTHAWMLENAGEDPYVVIALSNSAGAGIDPFFVQSVAGRLLYLVSQLP